MSYAAAKSDRLYRDYANWLRPFYESSSGDILESHLSVLTESLDRLPLRELEGIIEEQRWIELLRGLFKTLVRAELDDKDWTAEFERLATETLSTCADEELRSCLGTMFVVIGDESARRESVFRRWLLRRLIEYSLSRNLPKVCGHSSHAFAVREREYFLAHGAHPPKAISLDSRGSCCQLVF